MIFYNGRSSDDFSVIVEQYPDRPIPQRKGESWSVPGRSGDAYAPEEAWENVTRSYEVYLSAEKPGLPVIASRAMAWLSAAGYHELWDEYDRDTFVMATFKDKADIKNIQNAFGRFTLSFDCWPQRFLRSGAEELRFTAAAELINPTGFTAEPLITLEGSGSGTLRVGDYTITVSECSGTVLDCRDDNAYRAADGFNLNTGVSGDFPRLPPSKNEVIFSGGITAVRIVPRWYWI